MAVARTAIEFTFPAAIGKTYRIEDSTDLATWGTVESGIVGNGGQVQRFYSILNVPKDKRMSFGKIAARLQEEGFPTRTGKPWSAASVQGILGRPAVRCS